MAGKTLHMQPTIAFMESLVREDEARGAPLTYVTVMYGTPTYKEALTELQALRERGYEYVPCCDDVDERGRCNNRLVSSPQSEEAKTDGAL